MTKIHSSLSLVMTGLRKGAPMEEPTGTQIVTEKESKEFREQVAICLSQNL